MRLPKFVVRMAAEQQPQNIIDLIKGWDYSSSSVTPDTAQRISTVYACVNVLAETLASFPLKIYRKTKNGDAFKEQELSSNDIRLAKTLMCPNDIDTRFDFFERIMWHLALRGRSFCFKRTVGHEVLALDPIFDPDSVAVTIMDDYSYRFTYRGQNYTTKEIVYFRTHDGKSIIKSQKDIIGRALSINQYANSFFKNNASPNLVVTTDNRMDEDAIKRFKATWDATYRGAQNGNKLAILDSGKKLSPISVSNEDAQFLETNRYTDEQICGLFRVSPHLVGNLTHSTFSNIENLSIQFVAYTMLPWCKRIEETLKKQCIVDVGADSDVHPEFVMDGIERGDIQSRYSAYTQARNAGWMSANEIRKKENMNPIEGGDEYLRPENMAVVGKEPEGEQNA